MSDATQRTSASGFHWVSYAGTDTWCLNHPINDSSASSISPIMKLQPSWKPRAEKKYIPIQLLSEALEPCSSSQNNLEEHGRGRMKGTCSNCGKPYDLSRREINRANKFGKTLRCQCGNLLYEGKKPLYREKK